MLERLASGVALNEIAHPLGTSEHQIDVCLQALFVRLGAKTRAEAVASAVRRGLLAV